MKKTRHVLHLIITLLLWPWVIVWVWCAVSNSNHNKQLQYNEQKRQTDAMERLLANQEAADKLKLLKGQDQ